MIAEEFRRYKELTGDENAGLKPMIAIRAFLDGYDKGVEFAEPKKGKWKPIDVYEVVVACSECKQKFTYEHNYCPNCGAKMEVEE